MKEVSEDYISAEESTERQPCEIYDLWVEGVAHWRYTNGDTEVEYDGETYEPAPITRGVTEWDAELNISKMSVTIDYLHQLILQYVGENPVDITWIQILRLWRDIPDDAGVIFIGQVKSVAFKGVTAELECVGFEHYFEKSIPTLRYGKKCNWKLFDTVTCKVDINGSAAYQQTCNVLTIGTDNLTLTVNMTEQEENYYALGVISFGNYKRMITYSSGTTIIMRYPIASLEVDSEVIISCGCDGKLETCLDKFNNVVNFGGHPYIPEDNPSLWS